MRAGTPKLDIVAVNDLLVLTFITHALCNDKKTLFVGRSSRTGATSVDISDEIWVASLLRKALTIWLSYASMKYKTSPLFKERNIHGVSYHLRPNGAPHLYHGRILYYKVILLTSAL